MTEDDLLRKILKFTNDLHLQQQTNKDIASDINSQVKEFKHRSVNNKDNQDLDIENEELLPELLPVNVINTITPTNNNDTSDTYSNTLTDITSKHAKILQEHTYYKSRNRELEQECAELQDLVHQYDSSLDLIAGKLRAYAVSTTEGQVQLRREYEALLDAEKDTTVALFMENVFLLSQIKKLSGILRSCYDENSTTTSYGTQIQQLTIENEGLRTMLAISDRQSSSTSFTYNQTKGTTSIQTATLSNSVIQDYFDGNNSSISISSNSCSFSN